MTHTEFAKALRSAADWIESHPNIPLPSTPVLSICAVHGKAQMAELARAFGKCTKTSEGEFFRVKKDFGGVFVEGADYREDICKRRVVGAKVIPALTIPACTVEVVEWECPESLLDSG